MKIVFLLAASAALIFAQAAKVDKAPSSPSAAPTERPLTETESLKLQLTMAQISLLNKKYDIEKYQAELKPLVEEQQAVAMAACHSVGVSDDKVQTECALVTGVGQDGKPTMGQDGKPVQAKVWHQIPAAEKK